MPECFKGKKRERGRRMRGKKKRVGQSFSKQTTSSTLSVKTSLWWPWSARAEPAARPPEQICAWPLATKNYVMNSWAPFGSALLRCKPSNDCRGGGSAPVTTALNHIICFATHTKNVGTSFLFGLWQVIPGSHFWVEKNQSQTLC